MALCSPAVNLSCVQRIQQASRFFHPGSTIPTRCLATTDPVMHSNEHWGPSCPSCAGRTRREGEAVPLGPGGLGYHMRFRWKCDGCGCRFTDSRLDDFNTFLSEATRRMRELRDHVPRLIGAELRR